MEVQKTVSPISRAGRAVSDLLLDAEVAEHLHGALVGDVRSR